MGFELLIISLLPQPLNHCSRLVECSFKTRKFIQHGNTNCDANLAVI